MGFGWDLELFVFCRLTILPSWICFGFVKVTATYVKGAQPNKWGPKEYEQKNMGQELSAYYYSELIQLLNIGMT